MSLSAISSLASTSERRQQQAAALATQTRAVGHHEERLRRQFLTACNKDDTRTVLDIINEVSGSSQLLSKILAQPDPAVGTPLHVAARRGHLDTVKLLVQYNVDVGLLHRDTEGNSVSALLCALQRGHMPVVKLLVELGAHTRGAKSGGVEEWLAAHPYERRLVGSMGADSVKVHAVKEFRKKLEANRDIRQLKESIAEAEQAAAAASEQARAAVATAEREAKRAASADARKVALKQELLKKQAAYEQGRIDAEHAEAALQAWNRVMHETRVHSDGVGTSDQPGRSTAEAADGEIVAVAAPEAVPRSVTRPICTPLEISATCYASEGMELLWYKDGLPFVIPVHSAADTNDFPQNGPESEDNSLPAGEAVHRRAGVRRSVTNAAGEHHVPHVAVFTLSNEHFVEGKLQAINDAGRKEAHEQRMREREELLASNSDDGANSDLEEEHEEQGVAESADAALRAEDSVMGFGDSVYDSSPRNGRYFDSPRNSQLHAHSVLSGEDPFGGINMNSHGREAMHCDEKFCDTPYPTLAPPSIYNTVVQLTSSANENGNRRVESNAEAKQRPLDELVEDEEAFVLASNHLRDWLGTRAFFDIARGDFMLPDSRAGAERSGRHTATTFADDGFPRHYDVDDNAPTHAARHASNGNLDTGRPATQQSLLCRVVAQAFLKQALRFLPLDLIELPGADDQTEDNGAQGEIEAIRSGDDGASGDSNAEYEDFPAPVGDASNFENRRFKWKITLPAVGEDRTSAKINDNRGAFSYDESTPVTAKHAVDSMSTEGRLTDSSLRVLVSRSPAKFHFADDRMNTSDGAWESAAPAGSGRLVMTTPPRIRSTLYFPSIRFNDKGTYVCHLAKRVENTAESSCVNGVNEWQIVHRRICEVRRNAARSSRIITCGRHLVVTSLISRHCRLTFPFWTGTTRWTNSSSACRNVSSDVSLSRLPRSRPTKPIVSNNESSKAAKTNCARWNKRCVCV